MSEKSIKSTKADKYFCILCSSDLLFANRGECEKHLREKHFDDSGLEERNAIQLWIDRHLRYQQSLSKTMSESIKTIPDRSKTLYRGCPVCDIIMRVYDIRDDEFPGDAIPHEITIRDLNIHYSGNSVNHINPHLKYYPYECLKCEEEYENSRRRGDSEIKQVVKTAVKPMMRIHVKEKHFKDSTLDRDKLEEEVEKSIRILKVRRLEKITKKQQNNDKNSKPKKRKSIPGPLRETKLKYVSSEPEKRFRPIFPLFYSQNLATLGQNLGPKTRTIFINTSGLLKNVPVNQASIPTKKMQIESHPKVKETVTEKLIQEPQTISSDEELSESGDLMSAQVFGCVFCHKKIRDYEKAFNHYLLHFNVFIECAKCNNKFTDLAKFRSHDSTHNENCNLLNLNKFKVVRKWIQTFLNYLIKQKEELIRLTCNVTRVYCPVCIMMSNLFNVNANNHLKENETIETHIHQHLGYFPYECIDCNYEDIKTNFCLDSNAKQHLIDEHNIKNANSLANKELSTYFDNKTSSIYKFDNMIQQCVNISLKTKHFWEDNARDKPLN